MITCPPTRCLPILIVGDDYTACSNNAFVDGMISTPSSFDDEEQNNIDANDQDKAIQTPEHLRGRATVVQSICDMLESGQEDAMPASSFANEVTHHIGQGLYQVCLYQVPSTHLHVNSEDPEVSASVAGINDAPGHTHGCPSQGDHTKPVVDESKVVPPAPRTTARPLNISCRVTLKAMNFLLLRIVLEQRPQLRIRQLALQRMGTTPPLGPWITAHHSWITLKAMKFLLLLRIVLEQRPQLRIRQLTLQRNAPTLVATGSCPITIRLGPVAIGPYPAVTGLDPVASRSDPLKSIPSTCN